MACQDEEEEDNILAFREVLVQVIRTYFVSCELNLKILFLRYVSEVVVDQNQLADLWKYLPGYRTLLKGVRIFRLPEHDSR